MVSWIIRNDIRPWFRFIEIMLDIQEFTCFNWVGVNFTARFMSSFSVREIFDIETTKRFSSSRSSQALWCTANINRIVEKWAKFFTIINYSNIVKYSPDVSYGLWLKTISRRIIFLKRNLFGRNWEVSSSIWKKVLYKIHLNIRFDICYNMDYYAIVSV